MVQLIRVKLNWSGFVGAPGISSFYSSAPFTDEVVMAQNMANAALGMLLEFGPYIPNVVRISIDPEAEVIEDSTGELSSIVTLTPGSPIAGSATGAYAGPAGCVINWRTNTIRRNRRLRGRTFVVPIATNGFATDGSLAPVLVTAANAAVADYLLTPDINPTIWGRPTPGLDDGTSGRIETGNVPDMAAVLRSRRD